jgi:acyl transferase domain-containing protein/NAD(P)-dependent dehydrogenase (short-subunit alcohol dehydrogenase family)/acyl carrier protein
MAPRDLDREDSPIAVIGIGCRFPGARSPEQFWKLLRAGETAVTQVPAERWDADAFYDADLSRPASMNTRWGAFLDDVYGFDPGFFGISAGEAAALDPQQRALLEVSWEALEHAALVPQRLAGSDTAIFIGQGGNDYANVRLEDLTQINAYWASGNPACMLANRLSYFYDLTGPSITVDTGCSASLVAVHMACESLRRGETSLALAGGVHLLFSPRTSIGLSRAWMMSADGRCKSFDARADGYVRGEGCGLVVLKRLDEAVAAGDRIWAVVRGSAINQGGRGKNLTAPNEKLQEVLIRHALGKGGLSASEVDYVEAHGVGTPAADVAEARALGRVFGARPEAPVYVGSVKPNIGHLEPAAGVASLIKTVLALSHREIPPQLHFESLHPEIAESGFPFTIPLQPTPWPETGRPARAGVNSFGLGGSNAHVVLEAPPARPRAGGSASGPFVLTLSARSPQALKELARRYQAHLEERPDELADICFTSRIARTHFPKRLAVVAGDARELCLRLGQFLATDPVEVPRDWGEGGSTPLDPGWRAAIERYVKGADVPWAELEQGVPWHRCPAPTYAFEHRPFGRLEPVVPTRSAMPSPEVPATPAGLGDASQVHEVIRHEVASVLGREASEVSPEQGFFTLGMTSLMAMELRNRLQQRFGEGIRLPAALLFEYPTINALSRHVMNWQARGGLEPGSQPAQPALETPARVASPGGHAAEPVAVVGIGCRFPGGADSPEQFWQLLRAGVDATCEVPRDRWDVEAYYDSADGAQGKMYARRGGFLRSVDGFDPYFFGISPREAASMDPQQRLLLEVGWEALEHAGIPPRSLEGSPVGVFVGVLSNDYLQAHQKVARPESFDTYTMTGTLTSALAGRLSFVLKVRGPSVALDTACSSSLVAVHLACQSLRLGESRVALAGGVNVILTPELSVSLSQARAISPDGRCKTFDASADGYARGEGCGVVVLKRLSDAIADGDEIHAVIRGSAINHDGASSGFTVPSAQAQKEVIRQALASAGIAPAEVGYVEAHGTGTRLGDPIEVQALADVLGEGRGGNAPLLVGSVKTNIGHLESAAGIAGLIKAVLALRHGEIPRHLNLHTPNPLIPWSELPLEVPLEPRAWDRPPHERVAGVSSFGMSGMNAHLVLQGYQPAERPSDERPTPSVPRLLLLSGRTEPALRALAQGVAAWLEGHPTLVPADLCWTLNAGRSHHAHRFAVVGGDCQELASRLRAFARGDEPPGAAAGVVQARRSEGPPLVLPGTAADPSRVLELYRLHPRFRGHLDEADRLISELWGRESGVLLSFLEGAKEGTPPELALLAAFAAEYALGRLWASWGVGASELWGRGVGMCAAACLSGSLSLKDALRVVAALGQPRDLSALVAEVEWRTAGVKLVHAARGRSLSDGELRSAAFWERVREDVASPSSFVAPFTASLPSEWLAVGCEPGGRAQALEHEPTGWLRQDEALWEQLLRAGGLLYSRGHELDWRAIEPGPPRRPIALPTYPFQRQRCWSEALEAGARRSPGSVEARGTSPAARADGPPRPMLLLLSGTTEQELESQARLYRERLAGQAGSSRASTRELAVETSLAPGEGLHRAAVLGHSSDELDQGLDALLRGERHPAVTRGACPAGHRPRVVFMFSGHGTQSVGMARELMAQEGAFRDTLRRVDEALRPHLGWSVSEELQAAEEASRLDRMDVVHPCLFAIGVALAEHWQSWGVKPDAVVGHSFGEVIAAHVAGALTLEDAALLIARRSGLIQRVSGKGSMVSVELTAEEAEQVLRGFEGRASVALLNGPKSTVISGDPGAIEEIAATLEARDVFCRRVNVGVAAHSPQMDALKTELAEQVRHIRPQRAVCAIYSTVTGQVMDGQQLGPEYWARNLREPVQFVRCTEQLLSDGFTIFLELSPHPVLSPALEPMLEGAKRAQTHAAVPSLRRKQPEHAALLRALGELFTRGVDVPWERVSLPRTWAHAGSEARESRPDMEQAHPLLGQAFSSSVEEGVRFWQLRLSATTPRYLADHRVNGEVLFPATGYLEMAQAALRQLGGQERWGLEEVEWVGALTLEGDQETTVQLAMVPLSGGRYAWRVSSLAHGQWKLHAEGKARQLTRHEGEPEWISALRDRCLEEMSASAHYGRMTRRGVEYGPRFQGIRQLWLGAREALAEVALPPALAGDSPRYHLHPALLDSCLQVAVSALREPEESAGAWVPVGAASVRLHRPFGRELISHARVREVQGRWMTADVRIFDASGALVVEALGFKLERLQPRPGRQGQASQGPYLHVVWSPSEVQDAEADDASGRWLLVGEASELAQALERRLGARCVRLGPESTGSRDAVLERLRGAFGDEAPRGALFLQAMDIAPEAPSYPRQLAQSWPDLCGGLLHLTQAFSAVGWRDPPRLWLVTRGAQALGKRSCSSPTQAALWGMGRTIASEHPEWQCTRVDLDPGETAAAQAAAVYRELTNADFEEEIAFADRRRWTARLLRRELPVSDEVFAPARGRGFQLEPGATEGTRWRAVELVAPGPDDVEVRLIAARVSRPARATRSAPAPLLSPGQWVGEVVRTGAGVDGVRVGQLVVGLAGMSVLASHVTCSASAVHALPEDVDATRVAASLGSYLGALYILRHVIHLQPGERVLVNGETGEVVAAALLARRAGAQVLAFTRSGQTAEALRAVGVDPVFQTVEAAQERFSASRGEWIDVVYACGDASGDGLEQLPISPEGRCVLSVAGAHQPPSARRWEGKVLTQSMVDLGSLLGRQPQRFTSLLEELIGALRRGELPPVPAALVPASGIAAFLEGAATSPGLESAVVSFQDAQLLIAAPRPQGPAFRADATYLITGGLGGLGLALAQSMVAEGARHLALVGRSGVSTPEQEAAIEAMRAAGAELRIVRANVGDEQQVAELLAQLAQSMPVLRGLVHAAGVLDDALLEQQTRQRLLHVMEPKVRGAWNLHFLTRELPLDFFILYSSAGALLGMPGQLNYAAANASLDALAHFRRAQGLPALSINWGTFSEVGLAAAQANRGDRLADRGITPLRAEEASVILRRLLGSEVIQLGVMPIDFRHWVEFYPQAAGSPLLAELVKSARSNARGAAQEELRDRLARVAPAGQLEMLEELVRNELSHVLRIAPGLIGRATPLVELGLDSLMGLELRNKLESRLGVALSATLVWRYPTVQGMAGFLREKLLDGAVRQVAVPPAPEQPVERLPDTDLDELSDEELAALGESMLK